MAKVLVPFSEGVEEVEFTTIVDLLRRAGVEVTTASPDGQPVRGRSNITIGADASWEEAIKRDWDAVVLPGGLPNAFTLRDDDRIEALLQRTFAAGKIVAAICAAPAALARAGVLKDRRATSYPACQPDVEKEDASVRYASEEVVVDGRVITSRGPGTAIPFTLALIEALVGAAAASRIAEEIVYSG